VSAPPATNGMAPHPPRSPLRRWLWPSLAAAAAAALWGLTPTLVRWQVARQVAAYWPGKITVDQVDLHVVKPIELRGVTLWDPAGDILAGFESVTVAIQGLGWQGPDAARLAIRGVTLRAGTGAGHVRMPVTLAGVVATPRRDALHLEGWRVAYRGVAIADEIGAHLQRRARGLTIDDPTGRLLGVPIAVTIDTPHGPIAAGATGGIVSVAAIPLTALGPLIPADEELTRGTASVELTLHRDGETGWVVDGRLLMADADLRGVSLPRKLCHFLGIDDLASLSTAEAEIAFGLTGTVANVTRARMASGLPEMAIEPGSRIDLATGRIDASVVLAAGAKLGELPLLHPVGTLVKSLTRIHIHGHWQDPEEALFSRN